MSLSFVLSLAVVGCGPASDPPAAAPPAPPPAIPREVPVRVPAPLEATLGQPVRVEGRDLDLRVGGGDGVEIHLPYLSARLVPAGEFVDLEHRDSYELHVDAVEVRIPSQSLQSALDAAEGDQPLRDLAITADADTFTLAGRARFLGAAVHLRANPRVTDAGELVLDLEEISVLGVGVKGLLKAFRRPVEAAMASPGTVLDLRGEELHVDPFGFAAGPMVNARFTSAHIEGGALVARLGQRPTEPGTPGLTLRGGVLRRGGTILFDPYLHLVPQEAGGALELVMSRFPEQVAAGFTKVGGGRIEMHLGAPGDLPGG